jgi:DNA-3-methyladenine glycosylase
MLCKHGAELNAQHGDEQGADRRCCGIRLERRALRHNNLAWAIWQISIAAAQPFSLRRIFIGANPQFRIPATAPLAVLPLERSEIPRGTAALARFLLGKVLVRETAAGVAAGRIVETEAYPVNDPAGHAYRGQTHRNRSLFLEVGHAYVYMCYGTSYLLNVSSETRGVGAGVLLRALEPIAGVALMHSPPGRRHLDIARGPGRLTAALNVDLRFDGIELFSPGPLWIGSDGTMIDSVGVSPRIGISKAVDAPLRYFVAGSACLSGSRRQNAQSV